MLVHVLCAQCRVIEIAACDETHGRIQTAVYENHVLRWKLRKANRFIHQVFIGNGLAGAHARIGGNHDFRFGIIDTRGQTRRRKAAEHHGMNRADPCAGEHPEHRFGDHRHVDQYAITFCHAQGFQHRGHAIHFVEEIAIAEFFLFVGFRGNVNQRRLLGALGQVAIHGIETEIGFATDKPFREWRF